MKSINQILALQKAISKIIKNRFSNLTVNETNEIVADIVIVIDELDDT